MPIRLIPAHAGKTGHGPMTGATHPAHPRSRGENQIDSSAGNKLPGSSPLTRGKLLLDPEEVPIEGLIPAHAGKTRPPACQGPEWAAHPRSRGENRQERSRLSCVDGSSPLTRGKPADCRVPLDTQRLIPAHAGKTWVTSAASPTGRAHPRSRGENWSDRLYTSDTWGSSPLTRGKPARRGLEGMVRRLIPAHAGKTADTHRRCEYQAAHPRSRGENYQYHHDWYQPSGSSPLTRGKPARRGLEGMVRRLIPAHAGKT